MVDFKVSIPTFPNGYKLRETIKDNRNTNDIVRVSLPADRQNSENANWKGNEQCKMKGNKGKSLFIWDSFFFLDKKRTRKIPLKLYRKSTFIPLMRETRGMFNEND